MINNVRPTVTVRPVTPAINNKPVAPAPAPTPVKPVVVQVQPKQTDWTVGRVLKAAGSGVAGFVGGTGATVVADLLFHFGNNGGTAWPGGIYLMVAGAAALGAIALYTKLSAK